MMSNSVCTTEAPCIDFWTKQCVGANTSKKNKAGLPFCTSPSDCSNTSLCYDTRSESLDMFNNSVQNSSKTMLIFIIVPIVIILLVAIGIAYCIYKKRKNIGLSLPVLTSNFAYQAQLASNQCQVPQQSQQVRYQNPPNTQEYVPVEIPLIQTANSTNTSIHVSTSGFDLTDLMMFRINSNEINVTQTLGQGAFGVVLLATYQGTKVAVKKLLPNTNSNEALVKFIAEIKLMSKMNSPYIISFVGAAWHSPSDVMAIIEYSEMGDLRNFLQANSSTSMTWTQKLQLAYDIVQGLVYLHTLENKVIHRDMKSRNVLLTHDLHTELTDFGVSREMDDATMTAGIGTYRWMAPEVLQDGHYFEAADMFSFGVILTELDTHRLPYSDCLNGSGRPYTDTAIMAKVMTGQLLPSFSADCPLWYLELGHRSADYTKKNDAGLPYCAASECSQLSWCYATNHRLLQASFDNTGNKIATTMTTIFIVIGVLIVLVIVAIAYCIYKRRGNFGSLPVITANIQAVSQPIQYQNQAQQVQYNYPSQQIQYQNTSNTLEYVPIETPVTQTAVSANTPSNGFDLADLM
ncbi:kinase, partial [Thraustotheca clavata]